VSFEIAGKWMSADVINVSVRRLVGRPRASRCRDTALTLAAAGADCVINPPPGLRLPRTGWPAGWPRATQASSTRGDGTHEHPHPGPAGTRPPCGNGWAPLEGRRIAIVGDVLHSRVARSNVHLLRTLGTDVVLVAPPTLLPVGLSATGT